MPHQAKENNKVQLLREILTQIVAEVVQILSGTVFYCSYAMALPQTLLLHSPPPSPW